jgi:MFS family permease
MTSTAETAKAGAREVGTALVLTPLMLGVFAYGVLAVIVVPALPLFEQVLHAGETGATWLLTAFFLSAAAATALLGRLGDMFGKRRILLATLGVLAAGTLISAVSGSLAPQIVARVLQGSAGGLLPLSYGIVRDRLPHERIGAGIAGITAMISLGALGVVLPGLLIPHLSWRWLFWIPMILTLIALAGTWLLVPESPVRPGGRVNLLNAVLMMGGITAVVIGVSEGSGWGWLSGQTLGLLLGGLALCAVWIAAEIASSNPFINMTLMRQRPVWTTNVFAFMSGAGMYGAYAAYPVFAQLPKASGFAYGASMLHTGLYLLPFTVLLGVASPFAHRLTARFSAVHVLIAGSLLTAVGFAYMSLWHRHPYEMMISLGLAGLGFGLTLPTLFTAVIHAVPPENAGEASGIATVLRFIGGAVATQVVASLITSNSDQGIPTVHGFTGSFWALAGFTAIGVIAAAIVPEHRAPNEGN